MFGSFNLDRMNETDVRENIVAPLLRELGYRHSTSADIITEQILRYPKAFLGRKKSHDPDLRGKADYILEVDRRLRWVIEVKGPGETLGPDELDQAYSYAAHPEIKALFFVVTNGRQFLIYRTLEGPSAPALLAFGYEELGHQLQSLKNLLSPASLQRDFPTLVPDTGKPLAAGLRSFAKVINGSITYTHAHPEPPGRSVVGMRSYVKEGSVERTDDGKITAYLKFGSTHRQMDDMLRAWKLEIFEISTSAPEISTDSQSPTAFSSVVEWTITRGCALFDPASGRSIASPVDMRIRTQTTAHGSLRGTVFAGRFFVQLRISILPSEIKMSGDFEVSLS